MYSSSVQFSHSVVSDSLWPHQLQLARLPCPSPPPRACSSSCPSSQWWQWHWTTSLSASNASSSIRSADPWDLSGRAVAAGAPGLPVCCSLPVWLLPVDIKLQLSVEYSLSLNEYCWYTWVEIGCLNYFACSYFSMPVHHEARYSDLPRHKVRHVWQCSIIKWKWGWRRQGLSRAEGKVACVKEVAHMSMAPTHISHSWAQ